MGYRKASKRKTRMRSNRRSKVRPNRRSKVRPNRRTQVRRKRSTIVTKKQSKRINKSRTKRRTKRRTKPRKPLKGGSSTDDEDLFNLILKHNIEELNIDNFDNDALNVLLIDFFNKLYNDNYTEESKKMILDFIDTIEEKIKKKMDGLEGKKDLKSLNAIRKYYEDNVKKSSNEGYQAKVNQLLAVIDNKIRKISEQSPLDPSASQPVGSPVEAPYESTEYGTVEREIDQSFPTADDAIESLGSINLYNEGRFYKLFEYLKDRYNMISNTDGWPIKNILDLSTLYNGILHDLTKKIDEIDNAGQWKVDNESVRELKRHHEGYLGIIKEQITKLSRALPEGSEDRYIKPLEEFISTTLKNVDIDYDSN